MEPMGSQGMSRPIAGSNSAHQAGMRRTESPMRMPPRTEPAEPARMEARETERPVEQTEREMPAPRSSPDGKGRLIDIRG